MNARNQYLKVFQRKYLMAKSRKEKSLILDEYCRNTHQNRKFVIRKIRSSISLSWEKSLILAESKGDDQTLHKCETTFRTNRVKHFLRSIAGSARKKFLVLE